MDPTSWTTAGVGAQVNATAAGTVDQGQLEITAAGLCAGNSISQKFAMPPLSKAVPFNVSVTYGIANANVPGGLNGNISAEVGGRFFDHVATDRVRTDTFCLGAKSYGRSIDFRITMRGSSTLCQRTTPGLFHVDRFIVQPVTTDECPVPGTITNGDFEGTTGWTFVVKEGAAAGIVNGVGESSSRAAQLSTATRCSQASMTGMLSLPEQIANPAIDIYYSYAFAGTFGGRLTISFDGKNISVLPATITPGHARICLPQWAMGTTGALGLLLQEDAIGAGACDIPLQRTWTIDSVKLVSDSTCGATVDNADGGFERIANSNGPTVGWGLIDGFVNDVRGATAVIERSTANARTGSGVLRLGATTACIGNAGAALSFVVPSPQGTAGPALKLFANVGPNTNTETFVTIFPEVRSTIPEQGVYAQHIVCIPKRLAGRLVTARISTLGMGSCAPFAEEHAFVDDVQITTDISCTVE